MFRTSDIVLIAIMVSAAAMTYKIKRDAEVQLSAVRRIETQIRTEEDTIELLKADWSLLTQPSRLQKLSTIYQAQLGLAPVDPHQIGSLADIPDKPPLTIEDITSGRAGGMASNGAAKGKDPVVTGGIAR